MEIGASQLKGIPSKAINPPMLLKVTYEHQVIAEDLSLWEATQLKEQLQTRAIADGYEPLYVVEQQMVQSS